MFTISNFISFLRLLLAIPMWFLLKENMNYEALALGLFAILTDLSDGYIARKMNQISEWGKVIDPVADKVFVGVTAIALVMRGSIPMWFLVAVLARDILIMLGGLYASTKINMVIPSNYVGKATVICISSVLVTGVINYIPIMDILTYIATAAMLLSLIVYGKGMIDKIKAAENK